MPKVLILEHRLGETLALEQKLREAGFEVSSMTEIVNVISRIDFERPDFLLFDPEMFDGEVVNFVKTVRGASQLSHMVVILMGYVSPEIAEAYCRDLNIHGYYLLGQGVENMPMYLSRFTGDAVND